MLKHWGSLSQELCNCQYSIFLENLLGSFAVDLVGIVQGFEPVLSMNRVVHRGLLSGPEKVTDLLFLVT